MKLSTFSFLFEENHQFFIYNSLSNVLAEIPEEIFQTLQNEESLNSQSFGQNEETFLELCKAHFISEDPTDDFLAYKATVQSLRHLDSVLNLTIAPTMDCNYACPYCFELGKTTRTYMSEQTIQNLITFVNLRSDWKGINLTWFGGEPLLGLDIMKKLFAGFKIPKGCHFSSNIITNGYYLNDKTIDDLIALKISNIQVSLDGLPDTHNQKKICSQCNDTFHWVIDNIDRFSKRKTDIKLGIRVNLEKNNISEFIELEKYLYQRYKENSNIFVAPAFILDHDGEACKNVNNCILDRNEKARFFLELNEKYGYINSSFYPSNNFNECAIRNGNAWAFDPEGKVYKCWEIIGNEKYAIGHLESDGLHIDNPTLLRRYICGADPLEDAECRNCKLLPACFGGCPHVRIERDFNNKNIDPCTFWKNDLPSFLNIHRKHKENLSCKK